MPNAMILTRDNARVGMRVRLIDDVFFYHGLYSMARIEKIKDDMVDVIFLTGPCSGKLEKGFYYHRFEVVATCPMRP